MMVSNNSTRAVTRAKAERAFKIKFGKLCWDERTDPMCEVMPYPIRDDWKAAWRQMNEKRYGQIWEYFEDGSEESEVTFLRLLSVHMFINHTYKPSKKGKKI